MQEQVNEKTLALTTRSVKMTGRMLAKMMQAYLRHIQKIKQSKTKEPLKQGKQSLNSLKKQGASIADIEISGDNIGSFTRIARRYNLDFSLKKDSSVTPPNWIVFFKSKDDKSMESAFKEYSKEILTNKNKKPSLTKRIAKIKEKLKNIYKPIKTKNRGGHEL